MAISGQEDPLTSLLIDLNRIVFLLSIYNVTAGLIESLNFIVCDSAKYSMLFGNVKNLRRHNYGFHSNATGQK